MPSPPVITVIAGSVPTQQSKQLDCRDACGRLAMTGALDGHLNCNWKSKAGSHIVCNIAKTDNKDSLWKRIGYVPQSSVSKFTYPILDMVLLGRASHLALYEMPKAHDYEIAMNALERMGIAHMYKKSCAQISGGEYQLVLIARALAAEPELLILDEPESHLDFRNQILVLGTLEKVVRDDKLSCIINTHYPEHAIRLGDTSLMLGKGLPYMFGKASDIITADNLSKYFNVQVKMVPVTWEDRTYCSIIPLRLNSEMDNM